MIKNIVSNNTITLARTLLALGFLLTLIFTPYTQLFPDYHLIKLSENINGLMHLNFYLWFDNILIPFMFSIIVLLVNVLGLYPRYMCFLQSWVAYSIFYSMLIVEGGDQINVILTFLLIPISILDNRKFGWKIKKEPKAIDNILFKTNGKIVLLFIKIQMAILYLNAGIAKIFAPEWSNGTAVYYWFNDSMFGAPLWVKNSIGFLFENGITVSIINWSVIFLELGLFVAIFLNQRYKYLLFLLGVIFHFLIILIHGLPTFFMAMVAGLILYLMRLDMSIYENYLSIKSIFKKLKYEVV